MWHIMMSDDEHKKEDEEVEGGEVSDGALGEVFENESFDEEGEGAEAGDAEEEDDMGAFGNDGDTDDRWE